MTSSSWLLSTHSSFVPSLPFRLLSSYYWCLFNAQSLLNCQTFTLDNPAMKGSQERNKKGIAFLYALTLPILQCSHGGSFPQKDAKLTVADPVADALWPGQGLDSGLRRASRHSGKNQPSGCRSCLSMHTHLMRTHCSSRTKQLFPFRSQGFGQRAQLMPVSHRGWRNASAWSGKMAFKADLLMPGIDPVRQRQHYADYLPTRPATKEWLL